MPAVLAPKSIAPVLVFILNPAVDEYVPPASPVCVTLAVPVAQYGLPA